ncbi:MAG: tripartite tricarboxylate transporter substrate binding protein [Acetobacteraceae bacterium]|nr:tripartite tricarboxylate transporter substrate binding protein [Acetobacteraceae bacterium]
MPVSTRRALLPLAATALAPIMLALPRLALAQADWPARPVTLVVPFPPGGGTDTLGRMVAQALGARLGQPVVIENRGGAGGNVGSALVARAAPDGYTLLFSGNSAAISDLLFQNQAYNRLRDIAWVARTASSPVLLVVNETVPARSVAELIAHAKANPGRLNHGTAGPGTPFHLAGELFDEMAGTRIIHVPYRGTGPSVAGLLGNEVQLMFASATAVDGLIRDGRVRCLANTAARRARSWPEVPAIAETLPGYSAELWYTLGAPIATPASVLAALERAIRDVMTDPAFAGAIMKRGFDPEYLDAAGTLRALEAERAQWAPVLARANIRAE